VEQLKIQESLQEAQVELVAEQPKVTGKHKTDPKEPYKRRATSDDPILIIMLLDLSRSMFRYKVGDKLRIDVACELINTLLQKMYDNSNTSGEARPRYHVSIIGYHKKSAHILTKCNVNTEGENNIKHPANVDKGIYSIPMLRGNSKQTIITPALINQSIDAGKDVDLFPDGETHMSQALNFVEKLLNENIKTYEDSHPPYIFHITDGANNDDENPVAVFDRITKTETKYGNTLVATAYIGEDLLEHTPDVSQWHGVTDTTKFVGNRVEAAVGIRRLTSRMPAVYHSQLTKKDGEFTKLLPSMYMMFPGSSQKMLELALAMATATGTV
jgi:uncharacterized protein YegL